RELECASLFLFTHDQLAEQATRCRREAAAHRARLTCPFLQNCRTLSGGIEFAGRQIHPVEQRPQRFQGRVGALPQMVPAVRADLYQECGRIEPAAADAQPVGRLDAGPRTTDGPALNALISNGVCRIKSSVLRQAVSAATCLPYW